MTASRLPGIGLPEDDSRIARQVPAGMRGSYNESAFVLIAYFRRRMTDETGKNIFIMISTGQRDFVADEIALTRR